jgi:drug/metabolite transporter (DMT)-like permease
VVVKDAVTAYPAVPFLWLRFGLAALALAAIVRRPPDRRTLRLGLGVGLALAAGYLLQTLGLQLTSPGNAGVITGLFVVFTPMLGIAFRERPPLRTVLALVMALSGTVLLTGGPGRMGLGDLLVVGCAVAFALHIVLLSRWAPDLPAPQLAWAQMLACALVFTPGGLLQFRPPSPSVLLAVVITGLFASALAFSIQTWAQTRLAASRTALILTSEPAWALFFAITLAGQRLDAVQGLGALLVLAAIGWHEVPSLTFRGRRWP